MKTFWFDTKIGIKVFTVMSSKYRDVHGIYPTVLDELPKFMTSLGYETEPANIKHVYGTPIPARKGCTMSDEGAIMLLLKYNL